jgi:tetrapyrrole methylase family protein/MazG family protein
MEDSELNQTDSFLDALFRLVATLRGENGCPWDKKQTPLSVSVYLIEEVFELADAIEKGDAGEIREELGDVLFHIVFIARMFQEAGEFDLQDVAEGITNKMIRRHPHVFGNQTVEGSDEVIENWHRIKLNERKSSQKPSIFDSVPANLPALMRAYRISDRAAKSGIEYMEMTDGSQTPEEFMEKLKAVLKQQDNDLRSQTFGELLFTLVNICRQAKIHPQTALAGTVKKFERQFKKMEELISESNQELDDLSTDEKTETWIKAKNS